MINNTVEFRGKTEEGKWVYGYLYILGKGSEYEEMYILGSLDYREDICDVWKCAEKVIPETVGQFTGLRDRNGVKIFGADVLNSPRWVVTYCGNLNEGLGMHAGWYVQRDGFESWSELENEEWNVVLGNIYDNPELLKR